MTVFVVEMIAGATQSRDSIIAAGALWKPAVLDGQVWRIFTSMFLHADVGHIIGNCMALYVLGMAAEHGFGFVRAAMLYLLSGVCGAILSLLLTTGPSVGASGAIFGLAGGIIAFFWKYHRLFLIRDKRIGAGRAVWALYTIAPGFLQPEIDNSCHIGGFIGGALAGAVLPRRRRPELESAFAVILSGGASRASRGDGRLM
jgi:rhomboid protease GluP